MKHAILPAALLLALSLRADTPPNLVVRNIPDIPAAVADSVQPYLEYRTASLQDWNPLKREMLISTRFGDTNQLHLVRMPGGARIQLTFFDDRVGGASFRPHTSDTFVFSKDIGGGEFFQLYRYDLPTGKITLLTDGKSRNQGARWSTSGKWLAYSSTRRNGKDSDIYLVDPSDPSTNRMLLQLEGGGWGVTDFSPDDSQILVTKYVSANESHVYLADVASGGKREVTPKSSEKVSWNGARFLPDGKSVLVASDSGSEFSRLVRLDPTSGKFVELTPGLKWDVSTFRISPDGSAVAFITNEDGIDVLHLMKPDGSGLRSPSLPSGLISGLEWSGDSKLLGFTLSSARSPSDAFSYDVTTGTLERWTFSETGGLDTEKNAEPELVRMKSFDGLQISAFVYRPDPAKFPGKRPVMLIIHGGPEGQSRPGFLGRSNYFINELGMALVVPNVRGSSGYGKTYLAMDNGFKREDSVKDIGTVLDWIGGDARLDGNRVLVYGGSYGGYMTLATMTHFPEKIRAAIDVVGISNFVTFLKNTQDYRRDLRRVEYGDERDPKMNAFLERISPLTNAGKIRDPLFVVAGYNDPRVPYTEGEQMIAKVRENDVPVWFLMAKDEGHGFAKKPNQNYQMMAMVMFIDEYLLKGE